MRLTKRIAGARAKRIGDYFENLILYFARGSGFVIERIPLGARVVGSGFSQKMIRVKTPFDFILCCENKFCAFFDAKTIDSDTFPKSLIKYHQLESLLNFERCGFLAGYVIWFRKIDSVCFFKAKTLKDLNRGCSLRASDGISLGSSRKIDFSLINNLS